MAPKENKSGYKGDASDPSASSSKEVADLVKALESMSIEEKETKKTELKNEKKKMMAEFDKLIGVAGKSILVEKNKEKKEETDKNKSEEKEKEEQWKRGNITLTMVYGNTVITLIVSGSITAGGLRTLFATQFNMTCEKKYRITKKNVTKLMLMFNGVDLCTHDRRTLWKWGIDTGFTINIAIPAGLNLKAPSNAEDDESDDSSEMDVDEGDSE